MFCVHAQTLNCLPVAHVNHLKPEKLGTAELVEEVEVRARVCTCHMISHACAYVRVGVGGGACVHARACWVWVWVCKCDAHVHVRACVCAQPFQSPGGGAGGCCRPLCCGLHSGYTTPPCTTTCSLMRRASVAHQPTASHAPHRPAPPRNHDQTSLWLHDVNLISIQ